MIHIIRKQYFLWYFHYLSQTLEVDIQAYEQMCWIDDCAHGVDNGVGLSGTCVMHAGQRITCFMQRTL